MDAVLTFLGGALFAIGLLAGFVASLWFTIRAFQANILLGLGTIFLPIVAYPIFMFTRWEDARHPFWANLASVAVIFLGFGMMFLGSPDFLSPDAQFTEVTVADDAQEDFEDSEYDSSKSSAKTRDGFRVLNKQRQRPPSHSDRTRSVKNLPSTVQFDRASVLLHEKVRVTKKSGNTFVGELQEVHSDSVVVRQYFSSGRMDVPIRADEIERIDWNP